MVPAVLAWVRVVLLLFISNLNKQYGLQVCVRPMVLETDGVQFCSPRPVPDRKSGRWNKLQKKPIKAIRYSLLAAKYRGSLLRLPVQSLMTRLAAHGFFVFWGGGGGS